MQTFADWLRYYNDIDFAPGLEALEKMRAFYSDKGIDILKEAVSLPGVGLHYLLRGSVERGAELYSPCKDAYGMLKEAVVGRQSLVFTRYPEAGVTRVRQHLFKQPRACKRIIGYDANALYLSTMVREMPCGKEQLIQLISGSRWANAYRTHKSWNLVWICGILKKCRRSSLQNRFQTKLYLDT